MVFNRETPVGHEQRPACRHDWTQDEVLALYRLPFNDLIFQAQTVHRAHFDANEVQISTLLSIKTGGCPEDCAYCPQSAHFDTGLKSQKLMAKEVVLAEAEQSQIGRRDAVLHGGGVAVAPGQRGRRSRRAGGRRQSPRARDLRDPRHADAAAGRAAQGRGPRLLQSQPRYLRIVLRSDHHDPHLPGPAGHAGPRARGGHPRLLRRHPGNGRRRRGSRRDALHPGQPARASRERADQHARARARGRRWPTPSRSTRSISCGRSRWPGS